MTSPGSPLLDQKDSSTLSQNSFDDGSINDQNDFLHRTFFETSDPNRQNKDDLTDFKKIAMPFKSVLLLAFLFFAALCFGIEFYSTIALPKTWETATVEFDATPEFIKMVAPACIGSPCFEQPEQRPYSFHHVQPVESGLLSFLKYANKGPLLVSYDGRSLKINGDRIFLLGGSMHPARATSETWKSALDSAVSNGLNLITIYVMWSDHQPVPNRAIDWTFPDWSSPTETACRDDDGEKSCRDWNLAAAIRAAAKRGLFVHLRIGPYDCAEYSYGGIPEWLLVEKPNMRLRRPNREWLESAYLLSTELFETNK